MKRNHDNAQPFLLPISGLDFPVLLSALLDYALAADSVGDVDSAWRAYNVARRASEMQELDLEASRQAIAALGIGFARGCHQG